MGIQNTLGGGILNHALLLTQSPPADLPATAARALPEPTGFAPDIPYNRHASVLLGGGIGKAPSPQTYDAGDLYGPNGPKEEDIQQKSLNDCYFDATIGVVAEHDPGKIEQSIKYNPDSKTFTVTFYQKGPFGIPLPRQVEVTQADIRDNIARGGSSKGGEGGPIWPAVMEAAYAKMHVQDASKNGAKPDPRIDGGYGPGSADKLGPDGKPVNKLDANGKPIPELDVNGKPKLGADGKPLYQHEQVTVGGIGGGFGTEALYTVTGETAETMQAPTSGGGIFNRLVTELEGQRLKSAINDGSTVTVGISPENKGEAKDGLEGAHQYMVNRVYKDADGVWQVELRNPWGNNGSDGQGHGLEGKGDGGAVITVPLDSIHTHGFEGFVISPGK